MAIITYKCTVCNREIELPRNPQGLEVIGRCVITEGCRGELYQINVNQDYVHGNFPPPVEGLTDWTKRRVLYDHFQTVRSNEWLIKHNLGVNPALHVYGERPTENGPELIKIEPDSITVVNENTLRLTFSRAETGRAQCVARSTQHAVTVEQQVLQTSSTEAFQLTSSSELTIATTDNSTINQVELSFIAPNGQVTAIVYQVDNSPAITSPWSDYQQIMIQGIVYTVRSLNVINKPEFTDGTVIDSSSFYVSGIQTSRDNNIRTPNEKEILILLSQSPYTVYDKIVNQYIDATGVIKDLAPFSFYYSSGELFGYSNLIKDVFPHIKQI